MGRERGFGEAALLDQYLHKLKGSSSLTSNWPVLYLLEQLKGGLKEAASAPSSVAGSLFSVP